MTWNNFVTINTSKDWQYTPFFDGKIVRLRHSVINGQFPYGVNGLIAQSFNDEELELYDVRKIYPFYGNDIIVVESPLVTNQKLAIKGQSRYQTFVNWIIYVDVWQGESNLSSDKIDKLINDIATTNNYLDLIATKLDLILIESVYTVQENNFINLRSLGFI